MLMLIIININLSDKNWLIPISLPFSGTDGEVIIFQLLW